MGYFVVYIVNAVFGGVDLSDGGFLGVLYQLTQLLLMFWIAADLLKDQQIAQRVLLAFAFASVLVAMGITFQIPGFYEEAEGRASSLGDSPNALAANMAVAVLILVGLLIHGPRKRFAKKICLLFFTLLLLISIVLTGSRGGILGLMIGCLVYLLPYCRSKRTLTAISLALIAMLTVIFISMSIPQVSERWLEFFEEGNTAGRDEIFSEAISMILERPVMGWNRVLWFPELGRRMGGHWMWIGRDAHNLLFTLLLDVGLLGTFPFLVGLWLCGRSAWKGRHKNLGLMPLAFFFTVIVAGISGTTLTWKTQWLVLALSVAAGSTRIKVFVKESSLSRNETATKNTRRYISIHHTPKTF